ncbi:ATP-binding protein [Paludisphaera mucosa]|uniref:ATP-binding protein n=1 Tax=Paludisphaera mucosa TaxID=3030827 RepID=A0ABT6FJ24_9BACT|nr:ATP-binding protein [Paludisphaera mucosa]MDG3007582.1 ATP-binding protein [Paludisphaera mucosa]
MRSQLTKLDLLILDDLGYVPASKAGADLLFDVIGTAYGRTSVIVTTSLSFEQWPEVLLSERLTEAALDRLRNRRQILETGAGSYRLRDAEGPSPFAGRRAGFAQGGDTAVHRRQAIGQVA